jgi:glycosyltransferase involved in cell wall biosynthesis
MSEVTLAMPFYNVEKYIGNSLLSAYKQDFDSIKYILIDDGGFDNSMSIVKEIVHTHPRGKNTRIISHGKNIGAGATKNTAISNAETKYLFFMDSDDEITSDCISTLYNKMQEKPVDFVAASCKIISDNPDLVSALKIVGGYYPKENHIEGSEYPVAQSVFFDGLNIGIPTWNKLYDLSFLKKNGVHCIPNHLNEDEWFTYQLILTAQSCRLLPNITYFYNQRENSTMTNLRNKGYTSRQAEQYVEICRLQTDYSLKYQIYSFFPNLITENFNKALRIINRIYKSKIIPKKAKKEFIMNIFSSLSPYNKPLKRVPFGFRIKMLLIKAPGILTRIFFVKLYNKAESVIKKSPLRPKAEMLKQ